VALSDPLPLRKTTLWPAFAAPETLPVVYGRCTVGAVQFDATRKFWLVADHAIAGVEAVYRDGRPELTYAWRNAVDPTDHPAAVIELSEPLAVGASLTATLRGKIHPDTGALLENPADVLQDVLRLMGREVAAAELADFRAACLDRPVAGVLNGGLTGRAQLAELADSVGFLWGFAMPGVATRWPLDARPATQPLHAAFAADAILEPAAECRQDGLYTELRVEYDWDWVANRARKSVLLRADTAAIYGVRTAELRAKWLTGAAAATARGTEWLQAHARPRWAVRFAAALDDLVPPGGWFALADPWLPGPLNGEFLALDSEWDWAEQRQTLRAEVAAGPLPSVAVIGFGGLFVDLPSALRVTYASGIATLTVTDPNGAPIRNAEVKFGAQTALTDAAGRARFETPRGVFPVEVTAPGFQTIAMEITI
jgi:hypothetical protein